MLKILLEIFITLIPIILASSFLFLVKSTEKKFAIFFIYIFINILYFALYLNNNIEFLIVSIFNLFSVILIIYIISFSNRKELIITTKKTNKVVNIVIIVVMFLFYLLLSIVVSKKIKLFNFIDFNLFNSSKRNINSYDKIDKKNILFLINSNYIIMIYIIYIITVNIFNDKYDKIKNNREDSEK